jgi:hypothetical protein
MGQAQFRSAPGKLGVAHQQGGFRFEGRKDAKYLVAAFHHGVSYHTGVTNGIAPLEISVFDAITALRGLHEDSDTLFFESNGSTLAVTEFLAISNRSKPPRTVAGTGPSISHFRETPC